jgi:sec-independent protein translocase protein TatA
LNLLFTLLLFEDVSGGELIIVLLAVFLLFGPSKIPEIAKGIAKGIHDLKKATNDFNEEVNKSIDPIKKELQIHVDALNDEFKIPMSLTDMVNPIENKAKKPIIESEETKNKFSG